MSHKRPRAKIGIICSVAACVLMSGCSFFQKPAPERYGLAPGPKRIPALNPGGKLAQQTPPPAVAGQQPFGAPVAQQFPTTPSFAPPAPVAYGAVPPVQGYAPPVAYAPPPLAPSAAPAYETPVAAVPQQPFDLTSTSVDRNAPFPSLSHVPQVPATSAERVGNAQQAANELHRELNQSQEQRNAAEQQLAQDGLPWEGVPLQPSAPVDALPPLTAPHASAPIAGHSGTVSLDEIDRRFAGERIPPAPLTPPLSYETPSSSYEFPAPNDNYRSYEPSPALPTAPAAQADFVELPPIKLVPPADVLDDIASASPALPVPSRERFVPSPELLDTAEVTMGDVPHSSGSIALDVPLMMQAEFPAPPALQAKEDIFVPAPPVVASVPNGWDEYSTSSAKPITLTPPEELYASPTEQGFLPESRYEKRRRFQRRKARF